MNINPHSKINRFLLNLIQHYNHKKYWKYRNIVVNSEIKVSNIIKLYYLFRIKRMDAYHNASMGTDLNHGAYFATPPVLLHGLNGIIVSHDAVIGRECVICQQVTIGYSFDGKSPVIGDNCFIGAGAKIIGNAKIGSNVVIGANAVVTKDIPDNCTVVGNPAFIVKRNGINVGV